MVVVTEKSLRWSEDSILCSWLHGMMAFSKMKKHKKKGKTTEKVSLKWRRKTGKMNSILTYLKLKVPLRYPNGCDTTDYKSCKLLNYKNQIMASFRSSAVHYLAVLPDPGRAQSGTLMIQPGVTFGRARTVSMCWQNIQKRAAWIPVQVLTPHSSTRMEAPFPT